MREDDWYERFEGAVRSYKDRTGAPLNSISKAAGLRRGYLSDTLIKRKIPTVDSFLAVCRAVEVSPAYVLLGFEFGPEEEQLVRFFAGLDAEQKAIFLSLLQSYRRT